MSAGLDNTPAAINPALLMKTGPPSTDVSRPKGYFALRSVGPGELPRVMRKHIMTGCMGAVWTNLIGGIVYIYFGNAIGMTGLEWGILGGISLWVVAVQPLGAILGERTRSRKKVFFWFALTDRVLRMCGIVAAFFLWRAGNTAGYLLFMAAICIGSLVGNMANGPWYGWLATIIPPDVHGSFWGRRDSWISLATILVVLPSGFVMDIIPPGSKAEAAVIILVAGSLVGLTDLVIHSTIPEPPHERSRERGALADTLKPLKDRGFRPWLAFTVAWNFGMYLGGALCVLYFMENLGFKDNLLGGMIAVNVMGLLGTLLAARRVGRMVDRFGIKRMLGFGYFFWALLPAIWLFATPRTAIIFVGLASFIGGVFPAAANNAGVKLVTRFRPPEESSMYMAVSTTVGSLAGGIGSVVAGAFLSAMGAWSFSIFGLVVSAFPLLFIASFALRMTTSLTLIPRIRVTGSAPEEDRPFLLPLFFEDLPGISRIMRRGSTQARTGPVAGAGKPDARPGRSANRRTPRRRLK